MSDDVPEVITVAELQLRLRRVVEQAHKSPWLQGEVASLKGAPSGHVYFTLKDEREDAVIDCVMYRSNAFRARRVLSNGARVELRGRPTLYVPRGRLQFIAEAARPAGRGALLEALEKLKERLQAEGLFAAEKKRPLPAHPRVIGVVTSRSGAALHDICSVALRRANVRLVLSPALVQGEEAPRSLIKALNRLADYPGLDLVILGRGGGSGEDLMAFNDEALVRRVATMRVPVVSAVGHEVDVSLCDFAADVRAATPSAAAELAVPDQSAVLRRIARAEQSLVRAAQAAVLRRQHQLARLRQRLSDPRFIIAQHQQTLDELKLRLERAMARRTKARQQRYQELSARLSARHPGRVLAGARGRMTPLGSRMAAAMERQLSRRRSQLGASAARLGALSPLQVLARGYSIVEAREGRVLHSAESVHTGDTLRVRLYRGELLAEVTQVNPGTAGQR